MTVVFSVVSPRDLIFVGMDSALTLKFAAHDERVYQEAVEVLRFVSVGCVGLWGAIDGNRVGEFLQSQDISPGTHSIVDLSELVNNCLIQEYRPSERNHGGTGYHVAGYDHDDRPHRYHVSYGFDQPRPPGQEERHYGFYPHADPPDEYHFLFNGRTNVSSPVIR